MSRPWQGTKTFGFLGQMPACGHVEHAVRVRASISMRTLLSQKERMKKEFTFSPGFDQCKVCVQCIWDQKFSSGHLFAKSSFCHFLFLLVVPIQPTTCTSQPPVATAASLRAPNPLAKLFVQKPRLKTSGKHLAQFSDKFIPKHKAPHVRKAPDA